MALVVKGDFTLDAWGALVQHCTHFPGTEFVIYESSGHWRQLLGRCTTMGVDSLIRLVAWDGGRWLRSTSLDAACIAEWDQTRAALSDPARYDHVA